MTPSDSFDVFERDHPELVAIDGRGSPIHHTDFMVREREEMRQMTQATQICDNLWVGILSHAMQWARLRLYMHFGPEYTAWKHC